MNNNENATVNATANSNMNSNASPSKNTVNKSISMCLKDCRLFENKGVKVKDIDQIAYKNEMEYQNSFKKSPISDFEKSIPEKDKKEISICIYNSNNSDGLFSAWCFYKFLEEHKLISDEIEFIPLSAASGNRVDYRIQKFEQKLRDKCVIILDISYSDSNLEYIASVAKKLYIIDDHKRKNNSSNSLNGIAGLKGNWFIGDDKHSACAYTWHFFFPKVNVPIVIQYMDDNDRKLSLPYIYHHRAFISYINYRIVHSPYMKKFTSCVAFKEFDNMVKDVDKNFMLMVGHYYDELVNNIKEQVARNARLDYFQGHPVYVLNYNDPVLYKMVARQMITNAEKRGDRIDFAVLWGWEYTSNAYKVFISEKHGPPPKFNLPELAKKLGHEGGHRLAGFGSKWVGNFYWPRDKSHDIWDLFDKQKEKGNGKNYGSYNKKKYSKQ
jgi:hypothetical protein